MKEFPFYEGYYIYLDFDSFFVSPYDFGLFSLILSFDLTFKGVLAPIAVSEFQIGVFEAIHFDFALITFDSSQGEGLLAGSYDFDCSNQFSSFFCIGTEGFLLLLLLFDRILKLSGYQSNDVSIVL